MNKNIRTLLDSLELAAHQSGDVTAYSYLDNNEVVASVTYRQLLNEANSIAAWLESRTTQGDRIVLLFQPGIDFIRAFFGVVLSGNIAVPVFPPMTADAARQLQTILSDCEPVLCLTNLDVLNRIKKMGLLKKLNSVPFLNKVVRKYISRQQADVLSVTELNLNIFDWVTIEDVTVAAINRQAPITSRKIEPDDVAYLQYTSGSTGSPKGVMISHENLIHNIHVNHYQADVASDDVTLSWIPNYHNIGLVVCMLSPLCNQSSTYLMSPLEVLKNPLVWLQAISRYKATISGGPNFIYQRCVKELSDQDIKRLDLSSWKIAFCGGEHVDVKAMERFAERMAISGFQKSALYPAYGLAEATVYVMGSSRTHGMMKISVDKFASNSVAVQVCDSASPNSKQLVAGRIDAQDHTVIIVNPETRSIVSDLQIGEIWVCGKSVAQGYWNNPGATKETFGVFLDTGEGPFLSTGDLGFMHDGKLVVTGRCKEMIIVRGQNYYPFDIEKAVVMILESLSEESVVAFSIEGDNGEELVLLIEQNAIESEDAIVSTSKKIASQMVAHVGISPNHICFIPKDAIEKTPSAKKKRQLMRQRYIDNDLLSHYVWRSNASNSLVDESIIRSYIFKWLISHANVSEEMIDESRNLISYGLDSEKMMSLLVSLENEFAFASINPTILYEHNTIKSLIKYLADWSTTARGMPEVATSDESFHDDIAIVGMAARMPQANTVSEFWKVLTSGADVVSTVSDVRCELGLQFDKSDPLYSVVSKIALLDHIDGFDSEFFSLDGRESDLLCPQQRMLLECSWRALEYAGILPSTLSNSDTAIFMGLSTCDYRMLIDGSTEQIYSPYISTGTALSAAAGRLAYFYNTKGKATVVDSACSSSLVAVDQAVNELRSGKTSLAIVGGANAILSPHHSMQFAKAKMLAKDGKCKTFDAAADGYVRGEGAGVVILKRLSDAVKDNNQILGVIKASLVNQDGYSNGMTAPNGQSQVALMRQALNQASYSINDIDYIETHGTGTMLGDPIEANSICNLYSNRHRPLYIGSCKTVIGHLEAAAGIASLIKILLSFKESAIPPHLNLNQLNPHLNLNSVPAYISSKKISWPASDSIKRAAINSFGFTGTNAHLILESYSSTSDLVETVKSTPVYLCLSAKTKAAVMEYVSLYAALFAEEKSLSLQDVAYTLNCKRTHFLHRVFVCAESLQEFSSKLAKGEYKYSFVLHSRDSDLDLQKMSIDQIERAYLDGLNIRFDNQFPHSENRTLPLLCYPFQHRSHWYNRIAQAHADSIVEMNKHHGNLTANDIATIIKSELRITLELKPEDEISVDRGFMEMGLDSLKIIELGDLLQEKTSVYVDPYELFQYKTISQLSTFLSNKLNRDVETLDAVNTSGVTKVHAHSNQSAIIGLGCRFPGGINNTDQLWQVLEDGVDALSLPVHDRAAYREGMGGFLERVEYFDAAHFGISPREAIAMDPQQRILLEVIWEALINSKIDPEKLKNSNTGVFIGISSNDYSQCLRKSTMSPSLHLSTGNSSSVASGRISYLLGLTGPCMSVDTACSSSLVAVHLAHQSIARGECDLAIVAGVNLILDSAHTDNLTAAGMLSPDGRCKSFDSDANGFVRSEGCGVVILAGDTSEYSSNALAFIKGSAINQDGASSGLTAPNIQSQKQVILNALHDAGISGSDVDYIEAHGSGTPLGDPIELNAIHETYTPRSSIYKIGSIKASIGHTEAASGVAGLIKAVLAIKHQMIPKQINYKKLNPQIKIDKNNGVVVSELIDWPRSQRRRFAGVSSFGFSGTNCHVILSEAEAGLPVERSIVYPFKRELYWCDEINHQHAILKQTPRLIDGSVVYNGKISLADYPYLSAHDIFSHILFPAAAFCELALFVVSDYFKQNMVQLSNFRVVEALSITASDVIELQVLTRIIDESLNLDIYSRKSSNSAWILHCKVNGKAGAEAGESPMLTQSIGVPFSAAEFYQTMNANGIHYGDAFNVIQTLRYHHHTVMADLVANQATTGYVIHPTLLDGCFQTAVALSVAEGMANDKEVYLPVSIQSIDVYASLPDRIKVVTDVQRQATNETMYCNINIFNESSVCIAEVRGLIGKRASIESVSRQLKPKQKQLSYQLRWEQVSIHPDPAPEKNNVVVLADSYSTIMPLQDMLDETGFNYVYHKFHDYEKTLTDVHNWQAVSTLIVIDGDREGDLGKNAYSSYTSLGYILKEILTKQRTLPRVLYCYNQAMEQTNIRTEFNVVSTFLRSLSNEYQTFQYRSCLLDLNHPDAVSHIKSELFGVGNDTVCYRQADRLALRLGRSVFENHLHNEVKISDHGTYLVTGGMGSLGQAAANWLISKGAKHIVLLGRTIKEISQIRVTDESLRIVRAVADVTHSEELVTAISRNLLVDRPLVGIIHAAGRIEDGLFANLSNSQVSDVWKVKVDGVLNLDKYIRENDITLDFFITFSSIAAVFGSPAQSHYAAANAFLDAYMALRHQQGVPYYSIQWGPWLESGMAAQWIAQHERIGVNAISIEDNIQFIDKIILEDTPVHAVMDVDFNKYIGYFKNNPLIFSGLSHNNSSGVASLTTMINTQPAKIHSRIIDDYVKQQVAEVLGMRDSSTLVSETGFFDLGMDSLMLMELQQRLQNAIGDEFELSSTVTFDSPTIASLSDRICYLYQKQRVTQLVEVSKPSLISEGNAAIDTLNIEDLIKKIDDE